MESLRPTACTASAGTGEQDPSRGKPMGLVLDLRTAADLKGKIILLPHRQVQGLYFCLFS